MQLIRGMISFFVTWQQIQTYEEVIMWTYTSITIITDKRFYCSMPFGTDTYIIYISL